MNAVDTEKDRGFLSFSVGLFTMPVQDSTIRGVMNISSSRRSLVLLVDLNRCPRTGTSMRIGTPELIIFLVIILILFGVGRVSRIGAELGTAVREFRRGIQDEDGEETSEEEAKVE